ncbi:34811_t:CDS:2, partial [Gigaspora margarita]
MSRKPEFAPEEKELAENLKVGKCCIFAGAGVSTAIIHLDPNISKANANIIKLTVGSWAVRAVAIEFVKTYAALELSLKDIEDFFDFRYYIDRKSKKNEIIEAIKDDILHGKEFSKNESIIKIKNNADNSVSEINIEVRRIILVVNRVFTCLIPQFIQSDNVWKRGSRSVQRRIDELNKKIDQVQNENAKEKFKYFKDRYTELKPLFDKFSGDNAEESEYAKKFNKDFQYTLAGVMSVNDNNLTQTFRHLAKLVFSPLKSNPHSPLANALNIICENNVLLTSNYDTFLESALVRNALDYMEDLSDSNQLDYIIPNDLENDYKFHNRFVIHLHGLYYDKGSFVISEKEYKDTTNSFVKFMMTLILEKKRSLVFIGVSASGWTDWHMFFVFRILANRYYKNEKEEEKSNHPYHYWVVKRGNDFPKVKDFPESWKDHNEKELTLRYIKEKVKLVVYGDSYDDLAPYL